MGEALKYRNASVAGKIDGLDELETRDRTRDLAISETDFFCVQVLEKLAAF
jgi:hypothetical protein